MSSLSQLVNSAECGPSNPLQGLTKTFDRDRSLTQDVNTSRAAPSRGPFWSVVQNPQMDDKAAAFFAAHGPASLATPPQAQQQAWNLESMCRALPQQLPQVNGPVSGGWAQDFMRSPASQRSGIHTPVLSPPLQTQEMSIRSLGKRPELAPAWVQDFGKAFEQAEKAAPAPAQVGMMMGGPMSMQGQGQFGGWYGPETQGIPIGPMVQNPVFPIAASPPSTSAQTSVPAQAVSEAQQRERVLEADDLASTASLLLDSVRTETNPKFKSSAFMNLMHQFKDRTAVVEGNEIVMVDREGQSQLKVGQDATQREGEASSTSTPGSLSSAWARGEDVLGQAKNALFHSSAVPTVQPANVSTQEESWRSEPKVAAALSGIDPTWAQWANLMPQNSESVVQMYPEILQTSAEDWHEYRAQLGQEMPQREAESSFKAQEREWNTLLSQWGEFEAGNEEVQHTGAYRFQEDNPYTRGQRMTRHHALHTGADWANLTAETVLEKEAAVQRDPTNAAAWYELGVKQQENEREQKAIQALQRAVELDPEYIDAWLALAVSLVNEADRRQAYDAIEAWIERNARYRGTQKPTSTVASNTQKMAERQDLLMRQLIAMACDVPEGEIDADVQIALGVLFNINEDYEKAIDCFHAALGVRREDWQLYNRVGASYANSGNPEKALEYYYRALELNPGYIRARYNLGIAQIGLKHYTEAAQHILDALVLQESESESSRSGPGSTKGVTGSTLWLGLRNASAKLRRPDLVTLCDQQDLEAYRIYFAPLVGQNQAVMF